jgi:DNA-binding NarL/FixJ family response regulator
LIGQSPCAGSGFEGVITRAANLAGDAGPSAHELVLEESERRELEQRAACYTRPHGEVLRAKQVLLAAEGQSNAEIARRLGLSTKAVDR